MAEWVTARHEPDDVEADDPTRPGGPRPAQNLPCAGLSAWVFLLTASF
jgi:hypothetical protein